MHNALFVYNADNQRAKMEAKQNTTTILTRWYPSSGYIKETASGTTKEYTFIGGDPYTAPVVGITQSGTTTYYNLLRDHLGSITHVVNAFTNTLLYQYSYDAWGRMRNVSTWANYSLGSEPSLFIAGRGFTGHEHLPWFNLINMNGRMYDATVGQFLSPDNFVQNPTFTQDFNRYTYCLNNPLKYNDPDGEWFITALAMLSNMYVSTSAANGWQFNPVKWDWQSPKTWVSLVQSGISGYKIGSEIENNINRKFPKTQSNSGIPKNPEKYMNPGNHDADIPRMENMYAYNYRDNIIDTYTDGTPPPDFIYDGNYGTYTYVGKGTKYLKNGSKWYTGATVPIGGNKFDLYISPFACDNTFKETYQHEVGHVAFDIAKLLDIGQQESAINYRLWYITGKPDYWYKYQYYGPFKSRYGTIINSVIR